MQRVFRILVVGIITASVLAVIVLSTRRAPNDIRIAIILPLQLPIGQQMVNGAQLALDESERWRDRVEIVAFDTLAEGRERAAEINLASMRAAADDPAFVAIIGASSSNYAEASIPITNEGGLALISPLATAPHLTRPGYRAGAPGVYYPTGQRNFFRTIPTDDLQGQ
ncbi:MAG: hypothetical protein AAF125_15195, partial [Chloroflexota bacterium]